MSAPRPGACARGCPPGEASPRATVRRLTGSRVVAYHPSFAAIGGSINAGLFLAQLFYWHDRGSDPDGWIYKTQAEWEEETGLSRWEQETARRRLRERGLVEEKLAGLPARLHYRLDVERLIALLSARVKRTPSPPAGGAEGGEGGRRRAAAEGVTPPRTRTRERHNQGCGVPTNKHVGIPQTSSRGCHTHAETTIEHSREKGTERLAGSLQGSTEPGSDSPSEAPDGGRSPSRDGGASRQADAPAPEVRCSLHGVPMRLREKDGDRWYSHRLRDGSWCKGAPGDQGSDCPDPQSLASRREYLGWVDPDAHRRLQGARGWTGHGAWGAYADGPGADGPSRDDASAADGGDAEEPAAQARAATSVAEATGVPPPDSGEGPGLPADDAIPSVDRGPGGIRRPGAVPREPAGGAAPGYHPGRRCRVGPRGQALAARAPP
jgi:hypothetical protein